MILGMSSRPARSIRYLHGGFGSLLAKVLFAPLLLAAPAAWAQGSAVMTGTVLDASTKKPLPDVVVTVTSPALQGEQTVVTDKSGSYRIPNLPPGSYVLRCEADGYKPCSRGGITLKLDSTIRVNVEMLRATSSITATVRTKSSIAKSSTDKSGTAKSSSKKSKEASPKPASGEKSESK